MRLSLRRLCALFAICLALFAHPTSARSAEPPGLRLSGTLLMHLVGDSLPLGGELTLTARFPSLQGEASAPYYVAEVRDWRIESPWLEGVFSGEAFLRISKGRLLVERFSFTSPAATLASGEGPLGPFALALSGRAEKDIDGEAWDISALKLELGEEGKALALQGRASWQPGRGAAGLDARLGGQVSDAGLLQRIAGPLLPKWLQDAGATGSLSVTCELAPADGAADTLRLSATLQPRGFILWSRQGAGAVSGLAQLQATFAPDGTVSSWQMESSLSLPGGEAFKGARLALALHNAEDDASAIIKQCLVTPYQASGDNSQPLEIKGRLRQSGPDKETLQLENLSLTMSDTGSLDGDISLGATELSGSLSGKNLDIGLAEALGRRFLELPLQGYSPQGSIDVEVSLAGSMDKPIIDTDLSVTGLGFASPEGDLLAEGVALGVQAKTTLAESTGLRLRLDARSGGMLYDTVFLDLAAVPLSLQADCSLAGETSLRLSNMRLELGGLGLLMASGSIGFGETPTWDLAVTASRLQLEGLFTTFVRDPLSITSPSLAQASASGGASMEVRITGSGKKLHLAGDLNLVDTGFSQGENKTGGVIKGLNLSLPFDYDLTVRKRTGRDNTASPSKSDLDIQWGAPAPGSGAPAGAATGTLQVASIATPLGELQNLRMPVWLWDNEFGLGDELRLPLFGGAVTVQDIRVANPLSSEFILTCGAILEPIDLARVKAGPVPLQGSLQGDLGVVSLDRKRMSTSGALQGSFYGGDLKIWGIGARLPLDDGRTVRADMEVSRLVLERLSQALDLGLVSGRLDIDLKDLEIAYGQPVAFNLLAQSVPVDGVEQEISLKAVNAISVMGTGQGLSGAGVSMFASFFKTFSYQSIGMACDLNNDLFRVRGLINEGGVEYLIKKPPLFGINVINGNPENQISFSDMQKRLERVLEPGDVKISLHDALARRMAGHP